MTETTYLQFEGLKHPVALERAARLMPVLSEVLSSWPHRTSITSQSQPFVTIKPFDDDKWELSLSDKKSTPRSWNAVNTVCDLVAEMAWERIRTDPSLLCLHAAAVAFSGRLIIFPNTRRAGKSTMTAALARLGHRVYTDDFLPVSVDARSQTYFGIANGVTPRIRLPLPEGFSDDFHAWIQQDAGPSNKQYKYLSNAPLAPGGETMALGAMVILDRHDDPISPSLEPIPRAGALSNLITQNFARTQLSSEILKSMEALTHQLPVFRLAYHCGEEAAQFIAAHPVLQSLPTAKTVTSERAVKQAPLDKLRDAPPAFASKYQYIQAPGVTETLVDQDQFLADRNGLSIYRLNAGSTAIWKVLSEPTNLDEVIEILTAAFENVPAEQIASDSEELMRNLSDAGLIVPVQANMVAE